MTPKLKAVAIACTLAFAAGAHAEQDQQSQGGQRNQSPQSEKQRGDGQHQVQQRRADVNLVVLYQTGWSAEQMIGADVRGEKGEDIGEVKDIIVGNDGKIGKVVVEVGGFLEMGDQHIGVPWKDVKIGPNMDYVQVPLKEVENGTYSLYGAVPQGENVYTPPSDWRVNELIGDYASLQDVPRYGMVTDIIFNADGEAQAVVVDRTTGPWGGYGPYAYPYAGYFAGLSAYPLPYRASEAADHGRFDYARFGEQSRYANKERAPQRGGQTRRSRAQAPGATPQQTARLEENAAAGGMLESRKAASGSRGATADGGDARRSSQQQGDSRQAQAGQQQSSADGGDAPTKVAAAESEKFGKFLTNAQGRPMYILEGDEGGQKCTDECTRIWLPVLAAGGKPSAADAAVKEDMIGTIKRPDGSAQATYNGHPLYYYVQDLGKPQVTGQEVHDRWGEWYLLTPEGEKVEAKAKG